MNQQKSSKTLGDKFLNYVNSLCIGVEYEPGTLPRRPTSTEKSRRSSIKPTKRMTFLLDRALLKLSRKNLIVQQFAGQQALNAQIQDHLITRIAGLGTVSFDGDFSDKTVKSVDLGIRVLRDQKSASLSVQNILAASSSKRKPKSLQAMAFNLKGNSFKRIEEALATNFKKVEHFIFMIEAEVQAIDYHGLFLIYRDYFIFEVQKIMVINKCIANILYISSSGEFLKIENSSLAIFLSEELAAKDPVINKPDFAQLSLKLLNARLHVQTACVVGQLLTTSLAHHYDEEFVVRMKKRYPKSVGIIDDFISELRVKYEEGEIKKLPQFHQNTPEFKNEEFQLQNIERTAFEGSVHSERNGKMAVNVSFGMMIGPKGRNLGS